MNTDSFARLAWSKAETHLAEGRAQSPEVTPGATVHLAYYAMFHAARAVLLRVEGSSPKKHGSVVRQFGLCTKDRGIAFRNAGADLSDVQDRRISGDYGETVRISAEDADDGLRRAAAFLDLCSREFGFPREPGDTSD